MKKSVQTNKAPKAIGPYSQAIINGNLVFTSGQIHLAVDGKLIEGSIEEQTHQIMSNLKGVLNSADVSFKDVVKTTIYVVNMSDYAKVNKIYGSYFTPPYPARETVCVKELPLNAKIEISMIAVKSNTTTTPK